MLNFKMEKWPNILFMLCWANWVFAQILHGDKVRKDVMVIFLSRQCGLCHSSLLASLKAFIIFVGRLLRKAPSLYPLSISGAQ